MVTSASDIMLKHGSLVRGRFEMLGIVDAFPDAPVEIDDEGKPLPTVEEFIQQNAITPVASMASFLAPMVRNMMGRPPGFFGVTPLLIYREVSGA